MILSSSFVPSQRLRAQRQHRIQLNQLSSDSTAPLSLSLSLHRTPSMGSSSMSSTSTSTISLSDRIMPPTVIWTHILSYVPHQYYRGRNTIMAVCRQWMHAVRQIYDVTIVLHDHHHTDNSHTIYGHSRSGSGSGNGNNDNNGASIISVIRCFPLMAHLTCYDIGRSSLEIDALARCHRLQTLTMTRAVRHDDITILYVTRTLMTLPLFRAMNVPFMGAHGRPNIYWPYVCHLLLGRTMISLDNNTKANTNSHANTNTNGISYGHHNHGYGYGHSHSHNMMAATHNYGYHQPLVSTSAMSSYLDHLFGSSEPIMQRMMRTKQNTQLAIAQQLRDTDATVTAAAIVNGNERRPLLNGTSPDACQWCGYLAYGIACDICYTSSNHNHNHMRTPHPYDDNDGDNDQKRSVAATVASSSLSLSSTVPTHTHSYQLQCPDCAIEEYRRLTNMDNGSGNGNISTNFVTCSHCNLVTMCVRCRQSCRTCSIARTNVLPLCDRCLTNGYCSLCWDEGRAVHRHDDDGNSDYNYNYNDDDDNDNRHLDEDAEEFGDHDHDHDDDDDDNDDIDERRHHTHA